MNIIKSGPVLPVTIKTACSLVVTTNLVPSVLTGDTIMAPSIQVFLQVALFCCVMTTSMGGSLTGKMNFHNLKTK